MLYSSILSTASLNLSIRLGTFSVSRFFVPLLDGDWGLVGSAGVDWTGGDARGGHDPYAEPGHQARLRGIRRQHPAGDSSTHPPGKYRRRFCFPIIAIRSYM